MKIAILLLISFVCSTFTIQEEKTIDIKMTDNKTNNKEHYRLKDLEIIRMKFDDKDAYVVNIWRGEEAKFKGSGFIYGSKYLFEKAKYKWINDSIVQIHLFGSKDIISEDFHICDGKYIKKGKFRS